MKKSFVICDTNVWYRIGAGDHTKKELADKILVPTWINIIEISCDDRLLRGDSYVRNAVQKLKENINNDFINEDPFSFLARYAFPNIDNNSRFPGNMLDSFLDDIITGESKSIGKENFYRNRGKKEQRHKEMSKQLMEGIEKSRNLLQDKETRREFKNIIGSKASLDAMKNWVINGVNNFTSDRAYNFENYPWESIEFFMKVADVFFNDVKLDSQMKIQENDHLDFLNMVYVKSGYKYWTKEKRRWHSRIKKAGCENSMIDL